MTEVLQIPEKISITDAALRGAQALRAGKLVGFPTETVYGIAVVATSPQALQRLRELKDRPARPFSVHVGSPDRAEQLVPGMCSEARRLIQRCWPGPVTLVVETGGSVPDPSQPERDLSDLLCSDGWIGLRCPDEPVATQMLDAVPQPVVAPSANLAGRPSPRDGQDVLKDLEGKIDLLLDHGRTRCGQDSTIVRVGPGRVEPLRIGAVEASDVVRAVKRRIVFVCTGNTCRSPMAEGIAKQKLAQRLGCRVSQLPDRFYEVLSAGILAAPGVEATPEACRAAHGLGADISSHRSSKLTRDLIQSADVVFCMTGSHVQEVLRLAPDEAEKILPLSTRQEVSDPIGAGQDVYLATARQIEQAVAVLIDEGKI